MSVKRVTPDEAAELAREGWTLVDVRSVPEFEDGHPEGAYNVPLMHRTSAGMQANPQFLDVMKRRFDASDKVIVSCRSGGRSLRAAQILLDSGFSEVLDMRGGWAGEVQGGQVTCKGWEPSGLPTSSKAEPGRSWDELQKEEE